MPWVPTIDLVKAKIPEEFERISRYDFAIARMIEARQIFEGLLLTNAGNTEMQNSIRAQLAVEMQIIESQAWPTAGDVAQRDIDWSTFYDTACEVGKIIKPDFEPTQLAA